MEKVDAGEFWAWAYSDFLSNAQRRVLAELIVAKALSGALPSAGRSGTPTI